MLWRTPQRTFDLSRRGLIMGVVNVTADSFSDGGQFLDRERRGARPGTGGGGRGDHRHRRRIHAARRGAGAGSGGNAPRAAGHRAAREDDPRFVISIDTMKPAVARAAIECGAAIVNDVTGLRDPAMREVVRETGAGAIAMHMQGDAADDAARAALRRCLRRNPGIFSTNF